MEEGVVRNKIQPVVSPKTGENPGGIKRNSRGFSSFDRRRSGWFLATRMAGERRPASKLQIGTKRDQNGGRKWEIWPGHDREFQVGFSGLKFKDRTDKRTLMVRNGATVLKELIASSHGKYNPYRIFSAKELEIATNNYDGREVIKQCIFHIYKLYKGFWQERLISVLKFDESYSDSAYRYSINNIVYAAQMDHKHILKLIGCCLETPIPILVFEYGEYRTLPERIGLCGNPQPRPQFEPLRLKHRLKIAMDIAHTLAYLHVGFPRPIVFRHVIPSRILFNEENVAKLFDFSLSISIPEGETHITDCLMQPQGYCAPEYVPEYVPEYMRTGVFNEKYDVYTFSAVLLELLTGQGSMDLLHTHGSVRHLIEHLNNYLQNNRFTEIADPIIVQDLSCTEKEHQLQACARLTLECLNESAVDRATMVDVTKRLRQIYCSI
ncbi:non-functional pseudokinase ZRK2 [Citrus sinensis]|uniref:Non-functional pseudokinase ZRK2 n=1 Tax=Citrus sinensis TaxID=2711 RepID=A0ACB8KKZ0_CITSI|nr:non-functional pseudokinase ZRK2 [Citrus sinensis]